MPTTAHRSGKPADEQVRDDASRPDVIVDFIFEAGLLFVAIENIGAAPAVNAAIRFDKPFRGLGGARVIPELAVFRSIRFLAPRRRITTFVDSTAAFFARREPTDLTVRIEYADAAGRTYERTIEHDLAIYSDIAYVPGQPARSSE